MADTGSRSATMGSGKVLRDTVPRDTGARWHPPADRRDPVDTLAAQDADRLADLVPIRYGRMAASPFAFLRGAAHVMAADLATIPMTGLTVQACGDAHLSNFGAFASPERRLVFDLNDFDETLPAPWEFDTRRLAASVAVTARASGMTDDDARDAVRAAARRYCVRVRKYAEKRTLDVWYSTLTVDKVARIAHRRGFDGELLAGLQRTAARHDSVHAMPKLSDIVGGERRIHHRPPLVLPVSDEYQDEARAMFHRYVASLPDDRRELLAQYTIDDVALKVVGVGSVGTRCFVVLLHGHDMDDALVLQVKQATRSVLEGRGRRGPSHHGRRVVDGQRKVQGVNDILLGWTTGPRGRHYYWRQMWDAKSSIDPAGLDATHLRAYAELCAWALARAHARTGNRVQLAGYLGKGDAFADSLASFAIDYADQTERDHAVLEKAIRAGRVPAETGV